MVQAPEWAAWQLQAALGAWPFALPLLIFLSHSPNWSCLRSHMAPRSGQKEGQRKDHRITFQVKPGTSASIFELFSISALTFIICLHVASEHAKHWLRNDIPFFLHATHPRCKMKKSMGPLTCCSPQYTRKIRRHLCPP